ncbi:MAG: radical SAM protein [Nanoarchaeota archaeon]|nr:radical SAM protein [Nanoarchaeota archaeon]
MPINYTVSVTNRCMSRCKTCNVYENLVDDLKLEEYEKIFSGIGKGPYWFTFSGGEQFQRKDFVDIVKSAYKHCKPTIINIPCNGILANIIPGKVRDIVENCRDSRIILNLSLDEVKEKHDEIRGFKRNWELALKTYKELKEIRNDNFELGIHTVISKHNVKRFPEIYKELIKLNPDSYITEIAEKRVELGTLDEDITPSMEDYRKAINFLLANSKSFKGFSNVIQAFRKNYYQFVIDVLKHEKQILPCYSGFASAQISPDGEVWPCCIRGDVMGSLRENNYNFSKVWFDGPGSKRIRESIKNKECHCPLANAAYTTMLHHWKTMFKVGMRVVRS